MANKHISKKVLKKYLANKFSAAKQQEIEQIIANDVFLKDAIEGYKLYPNQIQKTPNPFKNTT